MMSDLEIETLQQERDMARAEWQAALTRSDAREVSRTAERYHKLDRRVKLAVTRQSTRKPGIRHKRRGMSAHAIQRMSEWESMPFPPEKA